MEQAQVFSVTRRRTRVTEDHVVKFYREAKENPRPKWKTVDLNSHHWTLQITPNGLGDAVMLASTPTIASRSGLKVNMWSGSGHYKVLGPLIQGFDQHGCGAMVVDLLSADHYYNVGPGHLLQRAPRLFGLQPDRLPKAYLKFSENRSKRIRCSIHLGAGECVAWQRRTIHPRAREVYPENVAIIREFIANHPEVDFCEVGTSVLSGLIPSVGAGGLMETIAWMSTAHVHIGTGSGPMHLAEALGMRTIVIINFPEPWKLMLPNLVNTFVKEEQWYYPQSSILHQDHDSAHWPKFSLRSLEEAFNNEVYPYGNPIGHIDL